MKNKVQSPVILNKVNIMKFFKRLLYKSLVVLAIIFILAIIQKLNFASTNNLLEGLKNNVEYEYDIVQDSKVIYNNVRNFIDASLQTVEVFTGSTGKYDSPVVGTIHRTYDQLLLINGEKVRNGGVDIKVSNESEPKSIISGIVSEVYENDNKGYYVMIQNEGLELTYGYLSASYVKEGDIVKTGQIIGRTGTSKDGNYYLRIELTVNGKEVDPVDYINFPKSI